MNADSALFMAAPPLSCVIYPVISAIGAHTE